MFQSNKIRPGGENSGWIKKSKIVKLINYFAFEIYKQAP